MRINAEVDYKSAATELGVTAPRQVPYVAATMLTKLAGDVKGAWQKSMTQVFDRPVDFTLRGVQIKAANKTTLQAMVIIPDSADKSGRASREYLVPGVMGRTARNQKKTEWLLSTLGYLPAGWVTVPGKFMKLDGHGNLSGRIYAQVINVLQLKARVVGGRGVAERAQKSAARLNVPALFFAVAPGTNKLGKNGSWLPPGVWRHESRGRIRQVLKFVKKAGYKQRLDLEKVGREAIASNKSARWRESVGIITERFARNGR